MKLHWIGEAKMREARSQLAALQDDIILVIASVAAQQQQAMVFSNIRMGTNDLLG